jgi:hypothetical protein
MASTVAPKTEEGASLLDFDRIVAVVVTAIILLVLTVIATWVLGYTVVGANAWIGFLVVALPTYLARRR